MKPNPVLYAQMEQYYQRYQQSKLSRPAFCQAEGLTYGQLDETTRAADDYSF